MNDRNNEVGLIAVIIGGVLFLGVILLLAGGIVAWMSYRNASMEVIEAERAAIEARKAQAAAVQNEAAKQAELIEGSDVQESVPD